MRDQFPQHHFGPLGISTDELIRFRKSFQRYSRRAEASLAQAIVCCAEKRIPVSAIGTADIKLDAFGASGRRSACTTGTRSSFS